MSVTITDTQWESIVVACLTGDVSQIKTTLDEIDRTNSKTRYYLWVKWLDLSASKKDDDGNPVLDWPPAESQSFISYTQFTRTFVEEFVAGQTSRYAHILVTDDPEGLVGWKELDAYFG